MTKIFLEIFVGISFREECVPFEFESYHLTLGGKGRVKCEVLKMRSVENVVRGRKYTRKCIKA